MNKKLAAEFFGTFMLVFAGAGAMLTGKVDLLGVALAHGLAIAIMIAAFGGISGAHFNPAVTIGFFITKRISYSKALRYISAQLLGATLASLILKGLYGSDSGTLGGMQITGISSTKAVLAEAVGTFLLMLVIYAVAVDKRGQFGAGFPIGLTIVIVILVIGPMTGAGLNPARWFGPALITSNWSNAWVWILGPIIGSGISALVYEKIFLEK